MTDHIAYQWVIIYNETLHNQAAFCPTQYFQGFTHSIQTLAKKGLEKERICTNLGKKEGNGFFLADPEHDPTLINEKPIKKAFYPSFYALLLVTLLQFGCSSAARAQGCIAIRHVSSSAVGHSNSLLQPKHFQISASYRYFRSYRHFSSTKEHKERVELGTEVINLSNSLQSSIKLTKH